MATRKEKSDTPTQRVTAKSLRAEHQTTQRAAQPAATETPKGSAARPKGKAATKAATTAAGKAAGRAAPAVDCDDPASSAGVIAPHPAHINYPVVALVLQGGGALGSYQAGVFQGLAESGIVPNWVAGISIGALNAAIIAGNPPEKRVERLREFWEQICQPALLPASIVSHLQDVSGWPAPFVTAINAWEAGRAMLEGQRGFFTPRLPSLFDIGDPGHASFYDTAPLKSTLEKFVDFDRINDSGEMRVSVGAVNVANGNFVYFDNTTERLRAEHFMASGALPPGFAAVEIDGEYYWDGGIVSNTPLYQILSTEPRRDSLIFQVDLWSAKGPVPENMNDVLMRQKDIQYSSRTRMITQMMESSQRNRRLLRELMELVPEAQRDNPWFKRAAKVACDRRFNVIHLIYQDKETDGHFQDFQFGALTMREHWHSGLDDILRSLSHPDWLEMPSPEKPFITHDVHRRPQTKTRDELP